MAQRTQSMFDVGYTDNRATPKSNKALLYVRVSTEHQADDGYSQQSQIEKAEEYAKRNELQLVKPYYTVAESAWVNIKEIKDISLMNGSARSAYNDLINTAIRDDSIGHIIFDVTDRIMRNDFDKPRLLWLIKSHKVFVHLARTGKVLTPDLYPDDEFMLDIESAVAKRYSNDISMKAAAGMREKARQGYYPSSAPVGYLNDGLGGRVRIDHELSPFVKQSFELMATGNYSLETLSQHMRREGLTSKKGNPMPKSSVAHMLKNKFYYGRFDWNGEEFVGKHTPLVSRPLWARVQEVLTGRTHKRQSRRHLFHYNRLIECGTCGGMILGERVKEKYDYYHCSFSKKIKHKGPYIRSEKMSQMFNEFVARVTIPNQLSEWLLAVIEDRQKDSTEYREKKLASALQARGKIKNRMSRLLDLHLDGDMAHDDYEEKRADYKSQLDEIEIMIDSLECAGADATKKVQKILELCNQLSSLYIDADDDQKVELLRVLGSNFVLDGTTICGTYRKPFNYLADLAGRTIWLPRLDSLRTIRFELARRVGGS